MIWVYINYPNPHFTIHCDPNCSKIQMHQVPNQRIFKVDKSDLDKFLSALINQDLRFASQTGLNDVWIRIELDTHNQEVGLVHITQTLIGNRYRPLSNAPIREHC